MRTNNLSVNFTRRDFGKGLLTAAALSTLPRSLSAAESPATGHKFCGFIKFLQKLSFDELADAMAEAGFDGVEVTVREKEGYIHPAAAADELPKFQETLAKRNLEITIVTTEILTADEPYARQLLETAAGLGIPRYRLGFYRYDLQQPILPQLAQLQPKLQGLADLNQELGIAGVYQNHCGADFFSATLWDLHSLIKEYPTSVMGCVFDIRHAAVEAGEAWPQLFNLMQPHISAISVKDYVWNGQKSAHAPLGEGRVDYPKYVELLKSSGFAGPISVHVEYLPKASTEDNLQALKHDLETAKKLLAA